MGQLWDNYWIAIIVAIYDEIVVFHDFQKKKIDPGSSGSALEGVMRLSCDCHATVMRDVMRDYSKHSSKMRFSLIFGSLGIWVGSISI